MGRCFDFYIRCNMQKVFYFLSSALQEDLKNIRSIRYGPYYKENLWSRKSQIRRLHQHKLHKKSLFLIGLKNDQISDVDDGKEFVAENSHFKYLFRKLESFLQEVQSLGCVEFTRRHYTKNKRIEKRNYLEAYFYRAGENSRQVR